MSDIAIKVENLSKYYRLGVINSGTLSRDLQSWIYKRLGKEDPNKRIGSREDNAEGFWALKDLNFEIKKGDRVGIIGHNGAGKSTLLKMLSQISSPTNGKIYIDGKIASLLEVGTGFNPELTGRENIYLNGAILGMKKKEVDRKIDEIIAFSEIERHIDTPVKRYSSGMYVRLAFAVAAHLDSDILIADEVLAVGDVAFQKKALGKMNELSSGQGRTVLFVSHNMAQVKNLCNKGIVLEKGRVVRKNEDIDDSISWYLRTGNSGEKNVTASWRNDGNFKDANFTPISFFIEDIYGNIMNEALMYGNKYFLKLLVDVNEVSPTVNFGISIYKGIECVYSSNSYEEKINRGRNLFVCEMPSLLLLPGNYTVVLGSTEKSSRWIINPIERKVFIDIKVAGENQLKWKKI